MLVVRAAAAGLLGALLLCGTCEAGTSTLDRVLSTHLLKVCTTGDYRPFSFRRADGSFEGMDIDIVRQIAESLGAQVEFVQTSWPTLLADFLAGKCDLAAGGVSVTLERQRQAGFSAPYLVDGKSAIARCADAERFGSLAAIDQADVRVVENPGGTNERFARAHLKKAQLRIHPDNVSIFSELVEGRADVMITDTSETLLQHKLHPELCALDPGHPFQYGEKAYMVARDDPSFKAYLDQWLHLAERGGTLETIENTWLK